MKAPSLLSLLNPARFFRLASLLAIAPLVTAPDASALSPQDSAHQGWEFPSLEDEPYKLAAMVVGENLYYSFSGNVSSGLRVRKLTGELILDHHDPAGRFHRSASGDSPCYGVSADGRIYYLQSVPGNPGAARIVILDADGERLLDFGPVGSEGSFTSNENVGPVIAVSPLTGRVYVSDEFSPAYTAWWPDPAKKGDVRVFDKEGNYLYRFNTSGILASALEGYMTRILVGQDEEGREEVYVVEGDNFKVFAADGTFKRILTGSSNGFLNTARVSKGLLLFSGVDFLSRRLDLHAFPPSAKTWQDRIAVVSTGVFAYADGVYEQNGNAWVIGFNEEGGLVTSRSARISVAEGYKYAFLMSSYPNYSVFGAGKRNIVPNPWVLNISQRPGTGIVDLDYRVDDADDDLVTTALVGFAGGTASLNNVLPLKTLTEGTAARVGANQPTNEVQRVTWDAGGDWNVDFGTLRVMALARDSRDHWFDVHLVEIPADGDRPAVTISRNVMKHEDFLVQFLWLVATKDPSVELIDGVLFGTTGEYDNVILANGTTSTEKGREFLLKRDGLRIATTAEMTRAREGATPGFVVSLDPPIRMHRTTPAGAYPDKINEFGIEAGNVGGGWYVVREAGE